MEVVNKRRSKISRNGVVVAGSVWENRMRFDEFKGGINVYSENEETPQVENDEKISTTIVQVDKKLEMGSKTNNLGVVVGGGGKRKTWKSESNFEGSSVQFSRKRSEFGKNFDEQCRELTVGAMKKSPIQKVKNLSPNGNLRNSIQLRKVIKSEKCKEVDENSSKNFDVVESKKNLERVFSESSDGNEENKVVVDVVDESKKNLERVFSESSDGNEENKVVVDVLDESKKNLERVFGESSDGNEENKVVVDDVLDESKKNLERVFDESSDGNETNQIQLRKVKSEANKAENEDVVDVLDESKKNLERVFDESSDGNEPNQIQLRKVKSEKCEEVDENSSKNSDVIEENKVVVVDVLDDESKKNIERVFGESSDGNEGNRIQLRKVKPGANKAENEDGNKGNLIQLRKVKPDANKAENEDGNEENRIQPRKVKSGASKAENEDGNEGNRIQLRKVKSGTNKAENEDGNEGNQIQLRKVKSEANKAENEKSPELSKVKSVCLNGNLRNSIQLVKTKSASSNKELEEEKCKKDFEENKVVVVVAAVLDESKKNCEEKVITSNVELQEKLNLENELEEDIDEEIGKIKTKKIVIVEGNKVHISKNEKKPVHISPIIKKQSPPISGQSRIHHHHPSPSRTKPVPESDESQRNIPRQHSKLESLVDLVMWRDASKSALIFGIGTFFIISSSYAKDLNISIISVISYLGLIYLATIFVFRSLRGANDIGETSEYVLGEEEAMWILKLILPYINEFLMKIRALFSGDPATTMKMAILLFILAKCGSSITIWKMSKLAFFGVFIVPKACSSYSTQLTAYGTFWIRRFRDAWVSCTHKKAVAFAIFTLIWNLSSISARIWAVFMLYVGFRYYQQKMMKEGWIGEEEITKSKDYWQEKIGGQRRKSNLMESKKQKKTF